MRVRFLGLLALAIAAPVLAQAPANPLDVKAARATDPDTLGWMQGTPPPPDKRIMVADGTVMAIGGNSTNNLEAVEGTTVTELWDPATDPATPHRPAPGAAAPRR